MDNKTLNLTDRIALRPVVPDDEEFLRRLYFIRRDDIAVLPLDAEQKNALLSMQYEAQKQSYTWQYANLDHYIVLFDAAPVGQYMVVRGGGEIRGVDLALLPEFRDRGIGTMILKSSFDEARGSDRAYAFQVLKTNRAIELYLRLGCKVTGDSGSHYSMEWHADAGLIMEKNNAAISNQR